jgi:hypothetical protein
MIMERLLATDQHLPDVEESKILSGMLKQDRTVLASDV